MQATQKNACKDFFYLTTAVTLLYAQKWKGSMLPIMEKWLRKMMELVEMAKLTSFITGGKIYLWLVGNSL